MKKLELDLYSYYDSSSEKTYLTDLVRTRLEASKTGSPLVKGFTFESKEDLLKVIKTTYELLSNFWKDFRNEFDVDDGLNARFINLGWEVHCGEASASKSAVEALRNKIPHEELIHIFLSGDEGNAQPLVFTYGIFQNYLISEKIKRDGLKSVISGKKPVPLDVTAFLIAGGLDLVDLEPLASNTSLYTNVDERYSVYLCLSLIDGSLANNKFLDFISKDRGSLVRSLLVSMYDEYQTPELERLIKKMFRGDKSKKLRSKAFQALAINFLDEEELKKVITEGLECDVPSIQKEAMKLAENYGIIIPEGEIRTEKKDERIERLIKTVNSGKAADRDQALEDMLHLKHPSVKEMLLRKLKAKKVPSWKAEGLLWRNLQRYWDEEDVIAFIINYSMSHIKEFRDIYPYGQVAPRFPSYIKGLPFSRVEFLLKECSRLLNESKENLEHIKKTKLGYHLAGRKDSEKIKELIMNIFKDDDTGLLDYFKAPFSVVDDKTFYNRFNDLKESFDEIVKYTGRKYELEKRFGAGCFEPRTPAFFLKLPAHEFQYKERLNKYKQNLDYLLPVALKLEKNFIIPELVKHLDQVLNYRIRSDILDFLVEIGARENKVKIIDNIFKVLAFTISNDAQFDDWFELVKKAYDLKFINMSAMKEKLIELIAYAFFSFKPDITVALIENTLEFVEPPVDDIKHLVLLSSAELWAIENYHKAKNKLSGEEHKRQFYYGGYIRPFTFAVGINHDSWWQITRNEKFNHILASIEDEPEYFQQLLYNLLYSTPMWEWRLQRENWSNKYIDLIAPVSGFYAERIASLVERGSLTGEQLKLLSKLLPALIQGRIERVFILTHDMEKPVHSYKSFFSTLSSKKPLKPEPVALIELVRLAWEIIPDFIREHIQELANSSSPIFKRFIIGFMEKQGLSVDDKENHAVMFFQEISLELEKLKSWNNMGHLRVNLDFPERLTYPGFKHLKELMDKTSNFLEREDVDAHQIFRRLSIDLKVIALEIIEYGKLTKFQEFTLAFFNEEPSPVKNSAFLTYLNFCIENKVEDYIPLFLNSKLDPKTQSEIIKSMAVKFPKSAGILVKRALEDYEKEKGELSVELIKILPWLQNTIKKNYFSLDDLERYSKVTDSRLLGFVLSQIEKVPIKDLKTTELRKKVARIVGQVMIHPATLFYQKALSRIKGEEAFNTFLDTIQPRVENINAVTDPKGESQDANIFVEALCDYLGKKTNKSFIPIFLSRFLDTFISFKSSHLGKMLELLEFSKKTESLFKELEDFMEKQHNAYIKNGKKAGDIKKVTNILNNVLHIPRVPETIYDYVENKILPDNSFTSIFCDTRRFEKNKWGLRASQLQGYSGYFDNLQRLLGWGFKEDIEQHVRKLLSIVVEKIDDDPKYPSSYDYKFIEWTGEFAASIPKRNEKIVELILHIFETARKKPRGAALAALNKFGYFTEKDS